MPELSMTFDEIAVKEGRRGQHTGGTGGGP